MNNNNQEEIIELKSVDGIEIFAKDSLNCIFFSNPCFLCCKLCYNPLIVGYRGTSKEIICYTCDTHKKYVEEKKKEYRKRKELIQLQPQRIEAMEMQ